MICMRCETRSADTGGLCTPCLTTWTDRFAAGVCAICGKDHEQASKLQPPASPPELPSTVIAIVGSGSPACAVLYRWSPDGSWPHCDQPFADEELFKEVRVPLQSDAAGFEQAMLRIGATVARLLRERDAGTARAEKAESDAKLAWRRVTELQERGTELVEERRAAEAMRDQWRALAQEAAAAIQANAENVRKTEALVAEVCTKLGVSS